MLSCQLIFVSSSLKQVFLHFRPLRRYTNRKIRDLLSHILHLQWRLVMRQSYMNSIAFKNFCMVRWNPVAHEFSHSDNFIDNHLQNLLRLKQFFCYIWNDIFFQWTLPKELLSLSQEHMPYMTRKKHVLPNLGWTSLQLRHVQFFSANL